MHVYFFSAAEWCEQLRGNSLPAGSGPGWIPYLCNHQGQQGLCFLSLNFTKLFLSLRRSSLKNQLTMIFCGGGAGWIPNAKNVNFSFLCWKQKFCSNFKQHWVETFPKMCPSKQVQEICGLFAYWQVAEESGLDDCGGKVYKTENGKKYYAYYMPPRFPYTFG